MRRRTTRLLPSGLFWIRAAVHERSDAVCRLQLVAAQAMEAVFTDRGNSPSFSAKPLPAGTISKLDKPDAAVKSIAQPFASFGGRGAESSQAFYTRISERLRHKDRAIDLWDYERLILEAFPQIYQGPLPEPHALRAEREAARASTASWRPGTSRSSPSPTCGAQPARSAEAVHQPRASGEIERS